MTNSTLKITNTFRNSGKVFDLDCAAAKQSELLIDLLDDFSDGDLEVPIPISIDCSDECLSKIIEWLHHHKDDDADNARAPLDPSSPIPVWDRNFFNVDSQMRFEILVMANYLAIKRLLEIGTRTIANMVRGMSVEQIRRCFNIPNDFTPQEEAEIRAELAWALDP
jgi:S-phase kinase-associated protein 1